MHPALNKLVFFRFHSLKDGGENFDSVCDSSGKQGSRVALQREAEKTAGSKEPRGGIQMKQDCRSIDDLEAGR